MDKSEKVLGEIKDYSEKYPFPIVGPRKGALLDSLVKKYEPKRILEIGTLVGYSAILMARHLKNGKIICIEINTESAEIARENIKKAGLKNIEIIIGNALEIIPSIKGDFDFVFIDATKEEYFLYLKTLERYNKIKRGCIVVADNVKRFASYMQDYLNYVRVSSDYESNYYDFPLDNDGMEVSIKIN